MKITDPELKEEIEKCIRDGVENILNKLNTVMRQTNYDAKVSFLKLKELDYDEIAVIKDYMGINDLPTKPDTSSTQQKIYKSFREFF